MKIQVRRGTFETNSSSTHSLVMCSALEWDKFKRGEMLYDYYNDELIPTEVAKTDDEDNPCYTYDDVFYNGVLDYETFSQEYTTENGEKVVAFGYFGYS